MINDLAAAKIFVRTGLIDKTATGILGAGIDPGGEGQEAVLIVIYTDLFEAKKFLRSQIAEGLPIRWVLGPNKGRGSLREGPAFKARDFFRRLLKMFASLSLGPSTKVQPIDGNEGRPGCFVKLSDGSIVALTANHLFRWRNGCPAQSGVEICKPACVEVGKSLKFGSLNATQGTTNAADCAFFTPMNVSLVRDQYMRDKFVEEGEIKGTESLEARTLLPRKANGKIIDASMPIAYEIDDGNVKLSCVFESQILLADVPNGNNLHFGISGDSGAVVVMAQKGGTFEVGDVLGLYVWGSADDTCHIVAPFHACLKELSAATATVYLP